MKVILISPPASLEAQPPARWAYAPEGGRRDFSIAAEMAAMENQSAADAAI